MQHHDETLAAYVAQAAADPDAVGVIVAGSVARGTPRPDSDVDVYLVVTEAAFESARHADRLSYIDQEIATYAGGYVDIKVASPGYLAQAVQDGDDPLRASFVGARVAWSRLDALPELVVAIPRRDPATWDDLTVSYLAQMGLWGGYFLPQGRKLSDPFLLRWAAMHLVYASSRALLAHHRALFAGPKYLSSAVAALPALPTDYQALVERLLRDPTPADGAALMAAMETFGLPKLTRDHALSRFVLDNELAWFTRIPPPEFR